MIFAASAQLLNDAVANNYIVGAFNVFNAESIRAVVKAADAAGVPVIVSVGEPDLNFMGADAVAALTEVEAEKVDIPVGLHLDHGTSLGSVVRCIQAGFSSVMIDASDISEEEGIAVVKQTVNLCHAVGVSVESMVGSLRLATEDEDGVGEGGTREELTDPEKAEVFVRRTGIDALAVSVGTEHGSFLVGKSPEIDMVRLAEISRRVDIPLVVHGGSAICDAQLKETREHRVGKINIGSALRVAFRDALVDAFKEPRIDAREALKRAEDAMRQVVSDRIAKLSLT
ncbi:MAG: class II fructose-bisphosphate aldolase family protein [Firmicutes bacterium]|nr:class II fructose-bisphosphate aldolase family protein [Bacillota bacterium]